MFKWLATILVAANGNEQARVILHALLLVGVTGSWGFAFWALGAVPSTVFGSGFARAEQVSTVHATVLEGQILEARIRQCGTQSASGKQFLQTFISDKLKLLYMLEPTSRYTIPPCSDLVNGPA